MAAGEVASDGLFARSDLYRNWKFASIDLRAGRLSTALRAPVQRLRPRALCDRANCSASVSSTRLNGLSRYAIACRTWASSWVGLWMLAQTIGRPGWSDCSRRAAANDS